MDKYITFSIPMPYKLEKLSLAKLARKPIAKPICKIANNFCFLLRRKKLSLEDLCIIKEIGFKIKILYDQNSANR